MILSMSMITNNDNAVRHKMFCSIYVVTNVSEFRRTKVWAV